MKRKWLSLALDSSCFIFRASVEEPIDQREKYRAPLSPQGLELAEARERFLAAPEEFQTRVHAINRLASERCPVRSYTLTHLRRILGKKNLVEYESRLFSQREAQELVQHAERFLGWARTQITPSPAR